MYMSKVTQNPLSLTILSVSGLMFFRYKDGCEIQPGDNITLQAEGTMRRLIIRSAETSDAGSYTCQAGNNSIDFTVNVRGIGTILTPEKHFSSIIKIKEMRLNVAFLL